MGMVVEWSVALVGASVRVSRRAPLAISTRSIMFCWHFKQTKRRFPGRRLMKMGMGRGAWDSSFGPRCHRDPASRSQHNSWHPCWTAEMSMHVHPLTLGRVQGMHELCSQFVCSDAHMLRSSICRMFVWVPHACLAGLEWESPCCAVTISQSNRLL